MGANPDKRFPALITTPLDRTGSRFPRMRASELCLLNDAVKDADLFFILRTRTRVDVGEWFRNGRLWVCVTDADLVMLAAGRIPFVQKVPFFRLQESVYNHITGEVFLAPEKTLKLKHVKMTALDGYQLLAQIRNGQNKET